ncbi:MAG: hypothetical protein K6G26_03855 [Lachnospiraceae bacterium]|nr:hypothetical protein [Lachnospiraceae bacterium]
MGLFMNKNKKFTILLGSVPNSTLFHYPGGGIIATLLEDGIEFKQFRKHYSESIFLSYRQIRIIEVYRSKNHFDNYWIKFLTIHFINSDGAQECVKFVINLNTLGLKKFKNELKNRCPNLQE